MMLPRRSRMKRPEEFRLAVRAGRRAGRPTLTGHLLLPEEMQRAEGTERADGVRSGEPAKVGFIVSRAVGSAVVRNRVKRRMRDLMRGYVSSLPGGCLLVVRANPPAATARQADLAVDLDLVIRRLLRRQVGALRQE